jgi:hypothetical protein
MASKPQIGTCLQSPNITNKCIKQGIIATSQAEYHSVLTA